MAETIPAIKVTPNIRDGNANPDVSKLPSSSATGSSPGEAKLLDVNDGMHQYWESGYSAAWRS